MQNDDGMYSYISLSMHTFIYTHIYVNICIYEIFVHTYVYVYVTEYEYRSSLLLVYIWVYPQSTYECKRDLPCFPAWVLLPGHVGGGGGRRVVVRPRAFGNKLKEYYRKKYFPWAGQLLNIAGEPDEYERIRQWPVTDIGGWPLVNKSSHIWLTPHKWIAAK